MFQVWARAAQRRRRMALWLDQWLHQRPLVLCYHRIASETIDPFALAVSPQNFADHLETLHRGKRRVVPLSQLWSGGTPVSGTVAITFDDGYADNLRQAKAILEQYGFPATFFLATGHIGSSTEFWWDELDRILDCKHLPSQIELDGPDSPPFRWEAEPNGNGARVRNSRSVWRAWQAPGSMAQRLFHKLYGYLRPLREQERARHMTTLRKFIGWTAGDRSVRRSLTWAEVDQLLAPTNMQTGGHTVHHADLTTIPHSDRKFEIEANKRTLEERTGKPVTQFAYPYGCNTNGTAAVTVELLRQAGFSLAFTTISAGIRDSADPFLLPRVCVRDWSAQEFSFRLALR
jgi:peptidoglycan/xylan/chitin deacetylase (PgdA/CDA1 family)